MKTKLIKISLIGKTNAGKSTLLNSIVGEKISITNKKINTTQDSIIGIKNIKDTQIIFYDTPGLSNYKAKDILRKKFKSVIWNSIESVDFVLYIFDVLKYNFDNLYFDFQKIRESKKPIILVFNKVDLIDSKIILPYIKQLSELNFIDSFFNISAKYNKGVVQLLEYIATKAKNNKWLFNNNEISDKDDIFISNECTRNAILKYLHQEIPYNVNVVNLIFKVLKNKHIKIKQLILLNNIRHKAIILGKNGNTIKRIREKSQIEIQHILQSKVHLYLYVDIKNEK